MYLWLVEREGVENGEWRVRLVGWICKCDCIACRYYMFRIRIISFILVAEVVIVYGGCECEIRMKYNYHYNLPLLEF